jgi:hypothetical protein
MIIDLLILETIIWEQLALPDADDGFLGKNVSLADGFPPEATFDL